jgi:methyl coenzyme M reductase subunit C-like uncharacterized protein (methanogenesis marker protein 7)
MKIYDLKKRLQKERPLVNVTLQIPGDVLQDLKTVAERLGFSSIEALMRAYIGQGLRTDLERLETNSEISNLIESLRRHGVTDEVIGLALRETKKVA